MNFPAFPPVVPLQEPSIQKMNLLDTVSPIMVWLSDQKYEGVPYMLCRTVATAMSCERESSEHIKATLRFLFAACALLLLCVSALAQSTTGRILGTLTDASGAAVAGATVVVTDVQRGTSRTTTTGESGAYAVPDL